MPVDYARMALPYVGKIGKGKVAKVQHHPQKTSVSPLSALAESTPAVYVPMVLSCAGAAIPPANPTHLCDKHNNYEPQLIHTIPTQKFAYLFPKVASSPIPPATIKRGNPIAPATTIITKRQRERL